MVSPWNTGLGNSTFSKPRLPTVVPSVVSPTLSPTATPRVKRLLTSGRPNSACCAAWKSTCNGCGFMVRQEKKTLSASVTVRPGWCWNTCPGASSSNSLPAMGSSLVCSAERGGSTRNRSARRSAGGGGDELGEDVGARRHSPEQALEVLAGGLVESGAGRPAAVLDEQRLEAAIGGVSRGALHARVGGYAGEAELGHVPGPQQALESRGVEGAHGGLVEHGLAGARGEIVEDLVLAPALPVADARSKGPHVRKEIAEVGERRAHGEIDHAQPARAEAGEQTLDRRHHHVLDPVEAVRAQRLLPGVLEEAAQPLVARGAGILHVHHHQGRPGGIQCPGWVELIRIVHLGRADCVWRAAAGGEASGNERRGGRTFLPRLVHGQILVRKLGPGPAGFVRVRHCGPPAAGPLSGHGHRDRRAAVPGRVPPDGAGPGPGAHDLTPRSQKEVA